MGLGAALALLAGAALLAAALQALPDLQGGLWTWLQAHRQAWQQQAQTQPGQVAGVFALVSIACTTLLLPTATLQALLAGALFGRGWGTLLAAAAASAGALLALQLLRWRAAGWLRPRLLRRLGPGLARLDAQLADGGAGGLFALRLVPLLPFAVVNAAMAFSAMPAWRFWWVTQLGMLPASFVYVNAGTELARLRSPADALQPPMLLTLAAVGLLPLLTRLLLRWRRVPA